MSTRVNVVKSQGSTWTCVYGIGGGNRGEEETFSSTLLGSETGNVQVKLTKDRLAREKTRVTYTYTAPRVNPNGFHGL